MVDVLDDNLFRHHLVGIFILEGVPALMLFLLVLYWCLLRVFDIDK